jgi:hypothetical protein
VKAIFLGDIIADECEISWIQQSDVAPLLHAYPQLEQFYVRGGDGLRFRKLNHYALETLVVQTGGLGKKTLRDILTAWLPSLKHLELWLGDEDYGGDAEMVDLLPLLEGTRWPNLRYLGLCNTELSDEIAVALKTAPIMPQLRVLDLSRGTLGDAGAAALLANPAIKRLKKLDIHHHYCSDTMIAELKALPIKVAARQGQGPTDAEDRFVAVSE